jgi:protein-S-isoprenylcysteine O-methyltransferase Ste14
MNAHNTLEKTNQAPDLNKAIRKRFIQVIVQTLLMGAILFISAGTLNWPMAWLMMGFYVVMLAVNAILMIRRNPEMVAERAEVKEGTKDWDRVLTSLGAALWLLTLLVIGLDKRFAWSPVIPLYIELIAFVLLMFGYVFASWAMLSNPFFAGTVRIQEERGHAVATAGPYQYVRHPGYSGWSLANLATPFALGSLVGLVPAVLFVLNFIIRTALEDKTLQEELDGYKAYTEQVRYRLVPGIW